MSDLWSGIASLPPTTVPAGSLTVWIWVGWNVLMCSRLLSRGVDDQGINYEITQAGAARCSQSELLVDWWFN